MKTITNEEIKRIWRNAYCVEYKKQKMLFSQSEAVELQKEINNILK